MKPAPIRVVVGTVVSSVLLGLADAGVATTVAEDGATITGTVLYQGEPPTPAKLNFGAEQQCALPHGDHMPVEEKLVVNPNHTLKWTLLRIVEDLPGPYTPPAEPLVYEQVGCVFQPHVGAVMVGQPVEVRNEDPVLHNVRAQSKQQQSFNIAQPIKGMKTTKTMKKQEIGIPLKCDVHFWMIAYLHVLSHPFFALTGDDGTFAIRNVPPGTYTLEAWHETLGTLTQTVTLSAGQAVTVDFTFPSTQPQSAGALRPMTEIIDCRGRLAVTFKVEGV